MKAIATYEGGMQSLIEVAIAENNVIYIRFQERTQYGYQFGKWMITGNSEGKIPLTIEVGFSVVRKNSEPRKFRLPENTYQSKLQITEKDFDLVHEYYSD